MLHLDLSLTSSLYTLTHSHTDTHTYTQCHRQRVGVYTCSRSICQQQLNKKSASHSKILFLVHTVQGCKHSVKTPLEQDTIQDAICPNSVSFDKSLEFHCSNKDVHCTIVGSKESMEAIRRK